MAKIFFSLNKNCLLEACILKDDTDKSSWSRPDTGKLHYFSKAQGEKGKLLLERLWFHKSSIYEPFERTRRG